MTAPGVIDAYPPSSLLMGSANSTSRVTIFCWTTFWTSTTGLWADTVTVSSSWPTRKSALIAAVKFDVSSMPCRLTVLKPVIVNVTVYVPGRRSTILYWP